MRAASGRGRVRGSARRPLDEPTGHTQQLRKCKVERSSWRSRVEMVFGTLGPTLVLAQCACAAGPSVVCRPQLSCLTAKGRSLPRIWVGPGIVTLLVAPYACSVEGARRAAEPPRQAGGGTGTQGEPARRHTAAATRPVCGWC